MSPTKPSLDDLRIERNPGPADSRRIWPIGLSILLLLAVVVIVWWWRRPGPLGVTVVVARAVTAGAAAERTVLNASGYVTARRAATVSSKVTGKVMEVLIEEGMKVSEGQVLARLDDTNVRASLRLAEAQLKSSEAARQETKVRIKEAELNLTRTRSLRQSSISAQADLEHAEAEAEALQARLVQQESDVAVAQQQVAAWQQQLDDTVIRAPFGGIVTSKNAQPGEMISPMSAGGSFTRTGICTIVDMESLEIEIDVNESYINRVDSGQPVEAALDAYPEWKIPCKVIAIIPTADRQKSSVKVRVGFDKLDRRILPEMSVKVAFRETNAAPTVAGQSVVIPRSAVQQVDGRDVVMVVVKGKAERRTVSISGAGVDEAIVAAGVAGGDHVITSWPKGLVDGAAVREESPKTGK